MGAPCTLYGLSIDPFRAGPTLWAAQDYHRPGGHRQGGQARIPTVASVILTGFVLNRANFLYERIQSSGHQLMLFFRHVALEEMGFPAVAGEEIGKLLIIHPGKHGWIRDLPAVEMKNRQHGTVTRRIQKFIAVPARSERARFRLAVSHHATREQVGVVEHRSTGVHDRITQFPTFVNRARSFGRRMTRNSSGEGKLFEQPLQALFVLRDVRIKLAVAALQVRIRDHSGAAVAGARQVDDIQIVVLDQAIEMGVDEVQTGRGPKVAEQPRLDVLDLQRFAEKWISVQINLADGKIVGRTPVGVDFAQLFGSQRLHGSMMLRRVYRGYGSHRILPFYFVLFRILIS